MPYAGTSVNTEDSGICMESPILVLVKAGQKCPPVTCRKHKDGQIVSGRIREALLVVLRGSTGRAHVWLVLPLQ